MVLVELHDKMPYLDKASDPMKLWDDGLHFAPGMNDHCQCQSWPSLSLTYIVIIVVFLSSGIRSIR